MKICLNYVGGNAYAVEINSGNAGNYLLVGPDSVFGVSKDEYAILNLKEDKTITLNTNCK